ncbi:MAG: iron-sulfur cluster assembly protein [Verrucomicrobiota bacterium]
MVESSNESISLSRAVEAIQIPAGTSTTLPEGTHVVITQSLGGSFTVHSSTHGGLFRIDNSDADALGQKPVEEETTAEADTLDGRIWEALKACYDPEIPVNIVDLGLIYSMEAKEGHVDVKMTLTAPGCGMGPAIAADAKSKIEALDSINSAEVEVVWEPQWNPSMISPAGKLKLGIED